MPYLLKIDSSANLSNSSSRQLSDDFAAHWRTLKPGREVIQRDLVSEPISHISETTIQAFYTPQEEHTPQMQRASDYSYKLITEFAQSEAILISVPTYNYGIPSSLKAYFDQIARVGETFRFTSKGPEGLLTDKPAYAIVTRGSKIVPGEVEHVDSYLRLYLSFLGICQYHSVIVDQLANPQESHATLDVAQMRIKLLLDSTRIDKSST